MAKPTYIPPEIDFAIPDDQIAMYPTEPRDHSRLIAYQRLNGEIVHIGRFYELPALIGGDLVILNDTRVLPVRVHGRRPGGGGAEVLILPPDADGSHLMLDALINPAHKMRAGIKIDLDGEADFTLIGRGNNAGWCGIWLSSNGMLFSDWLQRWGKAPLPPYIRRPPNAEDLTRYQTVYAQNPGSAAAPTAGLHFTNELMDRLIQGKCDLKYVTLDVGPGTFTPIRGKVDAHRMHREKFILPMEVASDLEQAKITGRRVTAVGTTVVRTLEGAAALGRPLKALTAETDIFIHPPYRFQIIDRLITNFHRPDSTLIQLVAALIGWDGVNKVYKTALREGFRFYSYGDAMVIL